MSTRSYSFVYAYKQWAYITTRYQGFPMMYNKSYFFRYLVIFTSFIDLWRFRLARKQTFKSAKENSNLSSKSSYIHNKSHHNHSIVHNKGVG